MTLEDISRDWRPPAELGELEQARIIGATPNMAVHQ